ncbi:hypothetical protein E2P81_ATG02780 [Venturia nashicola]|uniref:Uncharacterized protein n=1 Tax=Venturia nashicola TaxID=86259 RepID=A0A4Z1PPW8_9PEZI|nr:hypothetical protein E6O75_ATG02839 [Venturia nashicola]TLD36998.1 hypothetical protein E2P81_ATG02780 [Venturia nashicola]
MDLSRYISMKKRITGFSHDSGSPAPKRRYLPLFASPVNQESLEALHHYDPFPSGSTNHSSTPRLYKHHEEASTIELFYDLFFVGNLAYYTAMHQHVDAQAVMAYLKLFTLMWFTWLPTTLFDVRFSVDSVWNRVCKAVHFGVMTGFVFAGPLFDLYDKADDIRSFRAFALVLVVSRAILTLQYCLVMWQSRKCKKAMLPLGLSVFISFAAMILFLVARYAFPNGSVGWYKPGFLIIVAVADGLATMLVAIIWRIVSFKFTNLVERVGLLTLIIIGEGIIGMVKSVSCITKSQASNNGTEYGTVVAGVLLLYLIWMLYFDQIEHKRFGTIRQQIWALLHFPLHVAILLCVEGNTSLIVWNSAVQGLKFVWNRKSMLDQGPSSLDFGSSGAFISTFNASMWAIDKQFKTKSWATSYNWTSDLTAISNISSTYPFQSSSWNKAVAPIINKSFHAASVFVFESHQETFNLMTAVKPVPGDELNAIYRIFDVVVMYFYSGAASMLLILAICYWFGKLHKSKHEFGEIINRTLVGFTLLVIGISTVLSDKTETGFKIVASNWVIPIVVIGFAFVTVLDNVLLTIVTITHKRRNTFSTANTRRSTSPADEEQHLVGRDRYEQATRSNPASRNGSPFDASRFEKGNRSRLGSRASSPYGSSRYALYDQPEDLEEIHPALRDNTFPVLHSHHSSISAGHKSRSRQNSLGPGTQRGRYDTLASHSRENSLGPGFPRISPSHSRHSSVDRFGGRVRYDVRDENEDLGRGGLQ